MGGDRGHVPWWLPATCVRVRERATAHTRRRLATGWVVAIPDEGAERAVRCAVGEAAGGEPCLEVVVPRNARVEHVEPR